MCKTEIAGKYISYVEHLIEIWASKVFKRIASKW